MMTSDADAEKLRRAAQLIAQAFVDTIADVHPEPAPSGPMYAAFMQAGGDIESFQQILDVLVKTERLRYIGNHCYVLGNKEWRARGLDAPNEHNFSARR